ncbi:hypothetical protein B0H34DRAFT_748017 [Crassisporium funariophilum]|nr:hypothetical protein B0H34DRAFT_748017 [Crassisporium funariophilum]
MTAQNEFQSVIVSQFVTYPPSQYKNQQPQFAFLAKPPPPPQKKRPSPNLPLPAPPTASNSPPPTPVRNAYNSIITWASLVQPGSPAPRSPHRRPSVSSSRRPSITRLNRRPSITHGRAPSGSFIHIVDAQSTPSVGDFDLTALGYTSVFVHLPKTPTTPSPFLRQRSGTVCTVALQSSPTSPRSAAHAHIPIPPIPTQEEAPVKRKGMKRFRSLSILRPRSSKSKQPQQPSTPPPLPSSNSNSASTTKPHSKKHTQTSQAKAEICAATIAKRKRAKYAYVRAPPPLANDLAMMQFADGGSMESHVKRVMEAQAKAAAGSGAGVGVGDVYRDGKGGIWWDADEEWEYAHLLGGEVGDAVPASDEMDWVEFGTGASAAEPLSSLMDEDKENGRRSSVSTLDSDLDPKYLLTVPTHPLLSSGPSAPVEDRVLASRKVGAPGMSVLSLPARPRRKALHLNKAEFLVDMGAFGPRSPRSPRSPKSPKGFAVGGNPKGKARRRPAPLTLKVTPVNAVVVMKRPALPVWNEFVVDTFKPALLPSTATDAAAATNAATAPRDVQRVNKKPSRLGMRGLFTRRGD